jgi:hypothetical protein
MHATAISGQSPVLREYIRISVLKCHTRHVIEFEMNVAPDAIGERAGAVACLLDVCSAMEIYFNPHAHPSH